MTAPKPVTTIDVGPRRTRVSVEGGAAPAAAIELAFGAEEVAARWFRGGAPTPGQLEMAIQEVEDEVMRARSLVPAGSTLLATGAALRIAAAVLGGAGVVPIDAVEQLFQRIAAAALGDPTARRGLPADPAFAATALVLREFMHHQGFAAVSFPPG